MPNCIYAILQQVLIEDANPTNISFWTRSSANTLEKFTAAADDVWAVPPAQTPPAVSLTKGTVGNLYMNRNGWHAKAANGATIYKANDEHLVLFKWPQCTPFRTIQNLAVPPTKILLTGVATTPAGNVIVDLWGSECAPSQAITWNAEQRIKVALSAEGQHKYGVATLEVWPTSIQVSGKPAGGIASTVDILDAELADFVQHLAWADHHASVTLKLSAEGFGEFDVPPDNLRRLAEGYNVDYLYAKEIINEWKDFDFHGSQNGEFKDLLARARERFAGLPVPQ